MQIHYYLGFLLLTFISSFSSNAKKDITLNTKNSLLIRGQINEQTATDLIFDINKRENKNKLYLYLDTNGGSVDAGNKIINEIQKYNISCVASKAISMGFVILQSCHKRFVTPMATLMQHQMSYGISNEKEKVESYVKFIGQIGKHLEDMQAKRIGINPYEFKIRTFNDWWLFGDNAIKENCADNTANVKCSTTLTNQTYNIEYGPTTYVFSKCPLITGPIETRKDKDSKSSIFYI
tara:strand:- start:1190 stop:1897 length:708 start_codon:yes stop_codon:yes gene_type:complete